jgi:hypothetical protein
MSTTISNSNKGPWRVQISIYQSLGIRLLQRQLHSGPLMHVENSVHELDVSTWEASRLGQHVAICAWSRTLRPTYLDAVPYDTQDMLHSRGYMYKYARSFAPSIWFSSDNCIFTECYRPSFSSVCQEQTLRPSIRQWLGLSGLQKDENG